MPMIRLFSALQLIPVMLFWISTGENVVYIMHSNQKDLMLWTGTTAWFIDFIDRMRHKDSCQNVNALEKVKRAKSLAQSREQKEV